MTRAPATDIKSFATQCSSGESGQGGSLAALAIFDAKARQNVWLSN